MPGLWQPQASRRVAVVRLAPLYPIRFGYRGVDYQPGRRVGAATAC
jgi:hypothetical protein